MQRHSIKLHTGHGSFEVARISYLCSNSNWPKRRQTNSRDLACRQILSIHPQPCEIPIVCCTNETPRVLPQSCFGNSGGKHTSNLHKTGEKRSWIFEPKMRLPCGANIVVDDRSCIPLRFDPSKHGQCSICT